MGSQIGIKLLSGADGPKAEAPMKRKIRALLFAIPRISLMAVSFPQASASHNLQDTLQAFWFYVKVYSISFAVTAGCRLGKYPDASFANGERNIMKKPFVCCLILIVVCICLPALCAEKSLELIGQPKFEQGESLGCYVWKAGDTWKVRWTTFGSMRHFTGHVVAEGGDIKSLKRIDVETERKIIRPGRAPRVVVGPKGRVRIVGGRGPVVAEREQDRIEKESDRLIRFSARTNDDIDGFDFKVDKDARELRFVLEIDGLSRVDYVRIGHDARRPSGNPFVVVLQ
jgi:hypothetical protein